MALKALRRSTIHQKALLSKHFLALHLTQSENHVSYLLNDNIKRNYHCSEPSLTQTLTQGLTSSDSKFKCQNHLIFSHKSSSIIQPLSKNEILLNHFPPFKSVHRLKSNRADENGSSLDHLNPREIIKEDTFHHLVDESLHSLQEKIDEYAEILEIDGYDSDYSQGVLTIRLGNLGTYVINKQTPNRQIWFSSPISGPSRFDWFDISKEWIYKRTKKELKSILTEELTELLKTKIELN